MRVGIENYRIGNYYKNDKEFIQVEAWTFDCYKHDGLEPIELTEDILLKCGFEKAVDSNVWVNQSNRQTMFYELTFNSKIGASLYEDQHWIKSNIQYLHQLQNLYFALTLEELTIKL